METFLVDGPNPEYLKGKENEEASNPKEVPFLNANFIDFNMTTGEFKLGLAVANELHNCYNNAKYEYIYSSSTFSGVLMDIYYESKHGYFKHCFIVAGPTPNEKQDALIQNKKDIAYFQLDPIQ
jgi:hypothetical protein